MTEVVLVLGSNVEPERNLDAAMVELKMRWTVRKQSQRYLTAALEPAPPYVNQAVLIDCQLGQELKPLLREIEAKLGRIRPAPVGHLCPIDIDAVASWPPLCVLDEKSWQASYLQLLMPEIMAWFADTPATTP